MYTFGPLIAKNARSGRLLGGAPVTVTTLDGTTLDTYTVDERPLTLVTNHEGYAGTFTADTDQRVILARPRGGDPLPLYAHEGIQDAADVADTINTGRLSEDALTSTIGREAVAPARQAATEYLSEQGEVVDAAATRAVSVAADPAIAGAVANPTTQTAAAVRDVFLAPAPLGGTSDDTPRLTAALATLPAGGVLRLREGAYRLGTRWTINKPVTIEGAGRGRTHLRAAIHRPIRAAASDVTIRNLTVDTTLPNADLLDDSHTTPHNRTGWTFDDVQVNGVSLTFSRIGAQLVDGTVAATGSDIVGVILDKCEITNNPRLWTIDLSGVYTATIDKCWIHDNGATDNTAGEGIKVQAGAIGVHITNNIIENNGRDGIDVYSATEATITGNTIRNNGLWGIEAKWLASNPASLLDPKLTIANNTIHGNGTGGVAASSRGAILDGNQIFDHTGPSVSAGGAGDDDTPTQGVTIRGNRIKGGRYGVIFNTAADSVIEANVIEAPELDGIYLAPTSSNNLIGSNQVINASGGRAVRDLGQKNTVGANKGAGTAASRRTAHKATPTARTNTAATSPDPDLAFGQLAPDSTWAVRGVLFVQTDTDAANFRCGWLTPGGTTGRWNILGGSTSSNSWAVQPVIIGASITSHLNVGADDAGYGVLRVDAVVTIGSIGDLTFRWAQATADPGTTTLLDGSWLTAERLD